jgi:hypothetical protein
MKIRERVAYERLFIPAPRPSPPIEPTLSAFEREVIAAWRLRPFKFSEPAPAEDAAAIRSAFCAHGFELRLGSDGAVLVADRRPRWSRTPPQPLMDRLWANVTEIGALLDREITNSSPAVDAAGDDDPDAE